MVDRAWGGRLIVRMWRTVSHAVVRWISAVFTAAEGVVRIKDWPSAYGLCATAIWFVVTTLLIAPELLRLLRMWPKHREFAETISERAWLWSSMSCVGVSGYLFYLTGGGEPLPGVHL
jgi:membrane protein YdbS with pleckstrin-like domain